MYCRLITVALGILLALAVPGTGHGDNGIVEYETTYYEVDYVPCLGEEVEFDVTVTVRTHLVVTPSGGVHLVDNWFIEGTALGLVSGLSWFGNAASPYQINAKGGHYVEGWSLAALYKPLDGGPAFRKSIRIRIVYDANGVPRVEQLEPYRFRCLPN